MHFGQAFGRRAAIVVAALAQHLAIDHIIGVAAPGIEQHGAVARWAIEQAAGQCEAFRTAGDGVAGIGKNVRHGWASARLRRAAQAG